MTNKLNEMLSKVSKSALKSQCIQHRKDKSWTNLRLTSLRVSCLIRVRWCYRLDTSENTTKYIITTAARPVCFYRKTACNAWQLNAISSRILIGHRNHYLLAPNKMDPEKQYKVAWNSSITHNIANRLTWVIFWKPSWWY